MIEENWKEIGFVGVDSGQLLITDPCYIDSEWKHEDFENATDFYFIFLDGKEEKVEHCSERWFELIDRANAGEIKLEERFNSMKKAKHNFSYNAISQENIKKQFAQLNYELGHAGIGVAFNSGLGDGVYPVYAKFKNMGTKERPDYRISEVRIKML
jgi:hypothetical protein